MNKPGAQDWMNPEFQPKLVSVIIPTFNRRALLDQALCSVLDQSYRPIEVIVVDDGSTDGSAELVAAWCHRYSNPDDFVVRYEAQPNKGAPAARNRGLTLCEGEYIQFLDSDDILMPDKFLDATQLFTNEKEVDFVYCDRADFESGSEVLTPWGRQHADLELETSVSMVSLASVWTALPLFSRKILIKAGPWDERLTSLQDWEYIGRVSYYASYARHVRKIQAACRVHEGPRLSVNSWGKPKGILSNSLASQSIYDLVMSCDSPNKSIALETLSRRILSCVRVATAGGNPKLAKEILDRSIDPLFKNGLRIRVESWFWCLVLAIPESWIIRLFWPIRSYKLRKIRRVKVGNE